MAAFGCLYCSASVPRLDSSLAIFRSLPTLFEDGSRLFQFSILLALIFPILADILFYSACFYHRLSHRYFTSACPCGLVIFARIPPCLCFEREESSGTCPPYLMPHYNRHPDFSREYRMFLRCRLVATAKTLTSENKVY